MDVQVSDYTVTVDSDGVEWAWKVQTGRHLLPGVSRRITDVENDARSAIIATEPSHRFTGLAVDVEFARTYEFNGQPPAIVCDIDGTLALHTNRGPYDFDKVETDTEYKQVVYALDLFRRDGQRIILLSGRQEEYRPHTERWLKKFQVPYDELHMRPGGDRRGDDIVKLELFDKHVRDLWHPHLVLDDRDRCVYLWRKLGLACFQVADGAF
jgi:hypothetical protein